MWPLITIPQLYAASCIILIDNTLAITARGAGETCNDGDSALADCCFHLLRQPFYDARAMNLVCQRNIPRSSKAGLAWIDSPAEQNFIVNMISRTVIRKTYPVTAWIGIRVNDEETWTNWMGGENPLTWTNWDGVEPPRMRKKYVAITVNDSSAKWVAKQSSENLNYGICRYCPVVVVTTTATTTTTPTTSILPAVPKKPKFPLRGIVKAVAETVQSFGCLWLLAILLFTLISFSFFRIFHEQRIYHLNEEIALLVAHMFIFTMRSETADHNMCKVVSGCLNYLFLVVALFFCLESLHGYELVVGLANEHGWFRSVQVTIVGWLLPFVLMIIYGSLHDEDFVSNFSCWFNFGSKHTVLFVACPFLVLQMVALIITESASLNDPNQIPVPLANLQKIKSCKYSLSGLMIIIPVNIASWLFGSLAVYNQSISLYSIVFGLNIALGFTIWFFHTLAEHKIRWLVRNIWKTIRGKRRKKRRKFCDVCANNSNDDYYNDYY